MGCSVTAILLKDCKHSINYWLNDKLYNVRVCTWLVFVSPDVYIFRSAARKQITAKMILLTRRIWALTLMLLLLLSFVNDFHRSYFRRFTQSSRGRRTCEVFTYQLLSSHGIFHEIHENHWNNAICISQSRLTVK